MAENKVERALGTGAKGDIDHPGQVPSATEIAEAAKADTAKAKTKPEAKTADGADATDTGAQK